MRRSDFDSDFAALTGNLPFPWQVALYERFVAHDFPSTCDLPTGLGKTSVVAIWLIALAEQPERVPRRLAYVVNRRTVVDQTTDEIEKLRRNLHDLPELRELRKQLASLAGAGAGKGSFAGAGSSEPDKTPSLLAISTLRGQFADNREWSADPSRPAVVIGTVDMIGSRLLFSGYRAGFRTRPLYAGLLGTDALLVHDEAHLEPAFQRLIEQVRDEQIKEPPALGEQFRLKVIELSATARRLGARPESGEQLTLGDADFANPEVKKRIGARKQIHLVPNADATKLADEVADLALKRFGNSGCAVLIFARKVEDVEKIARKVPQDRTRQLTGTLRGLERDQLVSDAIFRRFLPGAEASDQTVYLVCTSAGEVGVNISADHMVCDLSTFDSMAQRLGRVNRFGKRDDTELHVFHPTKLDEKDDLQARLSKTLALMRELNGDGSPRAISRLDPQERCDAFAPQPITLSVTDILLDAWALTTIRGELPGRPKVEPYLHGIREQDPPETYVAWREEVGAITGELLNLYKPEDLLDDYPLKPQEILRDRSDPRVFKHLAELAKKHPHDPVWLVDDDGVIDVRTLATFAQKDARDRIYNQTVLLSPATGGLRDGMLDSASDAASDVADELFDGGRRRRIRVWRHDREFDEKTKGMRLIRRIDFPADGDDEDAEGRSWHWLERPAGGDTDGSKSAPEPIRLDHHAADVTRNAQRLLKTLALSPEVKQAVVLAAQLHDLGKRRVHWQRSIGNPKPEKECFAKSGKGWTPRDLTPYRHEFGSLLDVLDHEEFRKLARSPELQDLVLHLVAAHHGYARPHFPEERAVDSPEHTTAAAADMARQVPQRFARLQRKYGRWGLAYLESLLRAADYEASAYPTERGASQ